MLTIYLAFTVNLSRCKSSKNVKKMPKAGRLKAGQRAAINLL